MRITAILVVAIMAIAPLQMHGQVLTSVQIQEELRKAKGEAFIQVAGARRAIHGQVIERTSDSLAVLADGRQYRLPMASVLRIDTMERPVAKRGVIGFIVGLGIGAWCAFVCGQGTEGNFHPTTVLVVSTAVGTGLGIVTGLAGRGFKTIYRASGPTERFNGPLPCPATPLVVAAPLAVPDRATWGRTAWSGDYRSLGDARCDGVAIRRQGSNAGGAWQSGVELRFKDSGRGDVSVTARVTAQVPSGDHDKIADIMIEILDGAVVLASSTASVNARAGREVAIARDLRLSSQALTNSPNLAIRLTVATKYE